MSSQTKVAIIFAPPYSNHRLKFTAPSVTLSGERALVQPQCKVKERARKRITMNREIAFVPENLFGKRSNPISHLGHILFNRNALCLQPLWELTCPDRHQFLVLFRYFYRRLFFYCSEPEEQVQKTICHHTVLLDWFINGLVIQKSNWVRFFS